MRIAVFNTKHYDREFLGPAALLADHEVTFLEPRLTTLTSPLAKDYPVVCAFVNDELHGEVLQQLAQGGTKLIALRCAGFNNVDLATAAQCGIQIVRVPAYSPYAVAEHAVGLILTLNRRIHRAHSRVREGNFSIDGLLGFDMHGKTVGIIGTGKIGAILAKILHGFGCRLLFSDVHKNPDCEAIGEYVTPAELFPQADIISLHCPLMPETHHLINNDVIAQLKPGVMLINTSRGALIDTPAVIHGLKSGRIGYLGLDVYEEEANLFFEDLSGRVIQDDTFSRLLTFPNVLITSHQAFFTRNALEEIARVTMQNITQFERGEALTNAVPLPKVVT